MQEATNTVVGEEVFSTEGQQVQKNSFPPLPSQDWEGKLVGNKTELRVGKATGVPYINAAFEILNSATTPGGKNRWLFKMFFLGTQPNAQGKVSVKMNDGILGLARAYGEEASFPVISKEIKDKKDPDKIESQKFLDPRAVLEWLKNHDGQVLRMHSKIVTEKSADGTPTGDRKAEVDYFIASDSPAKFA